MATDYDAPRQKETDDVADESLEQLAGRRNDAATAVLDVDDGEELEDFELPGADLSGEEFTVRVVPKQRDEFADIASEYALRIIFGAMRLATEAVGAVVGHDHPEALASNAVRRPELDPVHVGVGEQAMKQDDGPPLAQLMVGQLDAV